MLLDKVLSNVFACGIELAFDGNATPSTISGWQPFYNSIFQNADFEKAYASISSILFDEESTTTSAGIVYNQKVTFSFPENDKFRSERIAYIHKIKYVKFKFTNNQHLIVGRNDITQNAPPIIKTSSNGNVCQVSLESKSISPAGFTPNINQFGLPTFIPLTLVL